MRRSVGTAIAGSLSGNQSAESHIPVVNSILDHSHFSRDRASFSSRVADDSLRFLFGLISSSPVRRNADNAFINNICKKIKSLPKRFLSGRLSRK